MKFRTEGDAKYHRNRVHDSGETCITYPRDKCGYQGQDLESLDKHDNEFNILNDLDEL